VGYWIADDGVSVGHFYSEGIEKCADYSGLVRPLDYRY
jgi:hypothetical protein